MVMNHFNAAVQGTVVDHAAGFRVQIDAVGTVREGLHAVAQFAFFALSTLSIKVSPRPLTFTALISPTLK
jgi:hypothetical protein